MGQGDSKIDTSVIPENTHLKDVKTYAEAFQASCRHFKDRTFLQFKHNNHWRHLTFTDMENRVITCTAGLRKIGIQRGDKVALLNEAGWEWVTLNFGVQYIGAATVMREPGLTADQILAIGNHGQCKAIVAPNDKVLQLQVLVHQMVQKDPKYKMPLIIPGDIHELMALGREHLKENPKAGEIEAKPEDLSLLCTTSGTTSEPKAVMHTQTTLLNCAKYLSKQFAQYVGPDVTTLLPHSAGYISFSGLTLPTSLVSGCKLAFVIPEELKAAFKELKPDAMMLLPYHLTRIWKEVLLKVRGKNKFAEQSLEKLTNFKLKSAFTAEGQLMNANPDKKMNLELSIRDKLVAEKIRKVFGGRLKAIVTSGAKCDLEMLQFFWGMQIRVFDGYCSTETLVTTMNTPALAKLGTAGAIADGVEVKIAKDSEVLVRGSMIFKGYYNSPHQTKEAFDEEGWFRTGDLGEMDGKFLKIIGRKKDMYIIDQRENVYPATLEAMFKRSHFIDDICIIGDGRQYLVALIHPQKALGIPNEQLIPAIMEDFKHIGADEKLQEHEYPSKIALIPEGFTMANGLLTGTFKPKRVAIEATYKEQIEKMYSSK